MKRTSLTASVVAAAMAACAVHAQAADLDYGRAPTDRYSSAYEDQRYRDLYAPEPIPRRYGYAPQYEQQYEPRHVPGHPVPPGYVYRDNAYRDNAYRDNVPGRYADRDEYRYRQGCVARAEIKDRLISEGWRDFQDLELNGNVARIRARRNGDVFALKVDRCTGEVLGSRLVERRGYGPYAYEDTPRRPYY